ncbi:glycosyltransferase family 4 protein [Clostridium perfringens]|nr:glycosyltransferase family 4 protein [Clostridium perfringens]
MKKKYVFISNIASPYQVKLCYSLQKYFNAEFWFYEYIDNTRPEWWKIPLGNKCKILKYSYRLPKIGYVSFGVFYDLIRFNPDIIVLGGFMKWHIIISKLAKLFNKKVIVMSEPMRYVNSDDNKSDTLRNKSNSYWSLKFCKMLFSNLDLYLGMGEVAKKQFIEELEFPKENVECTRYPQDIEEYYTHKLRIKKKGDKYRILFANRLVERYQPLLVLEIFRELSKEYSNIELFMNNDGALKNECEEFIKENNLEKVYFLDEIDSWNNMHLIYKSSDILILPATYSNGNGTMIEAAASGMGIVISNRINHIKRHFLDGSNCFICDLKVDDFVNAIKKYIDEPELLIKHGELSRKMVENRKNSNTAKIYYELLKKHSLI